MGLRHLTEEDQNIIQINNIVNAGILTSDQNDWNPTGFATADIIRVDIDANNIVISGMVAPSAGNNRILAISNINIGSDDIRFNHNDALSLEANRFLLRDNANKSIKPNETAVFWYDHTSQRWKPYNRIG